MSTSSILRNVVLTEPEEIEHLVNALEAAEQCAAHRPRGYDEVWDDAGADEGCACADCNT